MLYVHVYVNKRFELAHLGVTLEKMYVLLIIRMIINGGYCTLINTFCCILQDDGQIGNEKI